MANARDISDLHALTGTKLETVLACGPDFSGTDFSSHTWVNHKLFNRSFGGGADFSFCTFGDDVNLKRGSSSQAILSAVLIFLTLLAIRNHFKIK